MLTYFYTLSAVRMDKFSQDGPMILLLTRLILVFQLVSVPTFSRKRISPVILWFDPGLIAREGFPNVKNVPYNILKVLRNAVKGKHIHFN